MSLCLRGAALLALLPAVLSGGAARADTAVVGPGPLGSFQLEAVGASYLVGSTATARFATGPATPPLGTGSLQMDTGASAYDGVIFHTSGYASRRLADLTELKYHTYVTNNGSCQTAYLVLQIDRTGDGVADDNLTFEPCYQLAGYGVPAQGPVVLRSWQPWDALMGGFWLNTGGPPVFTLQSYLQKYPDAVLVNTPHGTGAVRLQLGFGVVVAAAADRLVIGFGGQSTIYDLEPAPPAAAQPDGGAAAIDAAAAPDAGAIRIIGGGGLGCQAAPGARGGPPGGVLFLAAGLWGLRRRRGTRTG